VRKEARGTVHALAFVISLPRDNDDHPSMLAVDGYK
jgi:hypothetical protein